MTKKKKTQNNNFIIRFIMQFIGFLQKDFKLLVKRKKYLYLTLLFPIILSVIYIFILTPQPMKFDLGVCSLDSEMYVSKLLSGQEDFNYIGYNYTTCSDENLTLIKEDIRKGRTIAFLMIPDGFNDKITNYKQTEIIIYSDNTDMTLKSSIYWKVKSVIDNYKKSLLDSTNNQLKEEIVKIEEGINFTNEYVEEIPFKTIKNKIQNKIDETQKSIEKINGLETNFIINPVDVNMKPIYDVKEDSAIGLTFIFPIIALFVTLMLASTNYIYDRKTNYIVRLRASSASGIMYLISKIVFFFVLVLAQFLLVFLLFKFNGSVFNINWFGLLEVILLVAVVDSLIGILIGLISENEGVAVLISLILTMPFMFLSGIFYSVKVMPALFQTIANIFPLNIQIELMKYVVLFESYKPHNLWIYSIILFVIVYFIFRKKRV